jgi:hypothetical protein
MFVAFHDFISDFIPDLNPCPAMELVAELFESSEVLPKITESLKNELTPRASSMSGIEMIEEKEVDVKAWVVERDFFPADVKSVTIRFKNKLMMNMLHMFVRKKKTLRSMIVKTVAALGISGDAVDTFDIPQCLTTDLKTEVRNSQVQRRENKVLKLKELAMHAVDMFHSWRAHKVPGEGARVTFVTS